MSEENNTRTVESISREYSNGCVKAGDLQYKISVMSEDLSLLNKTLKDLNFEAASLQAKTASEAKAKADAAAQSAPIIEGEANVS